MILIVANLGHATTNIVPVTEMLVFTFHFFILVSAWKQMVLASRSNSCLFGVRIKLCQYKPFFPPQIVQEM